ncbi:MAG: UDP-N-acetylmuramoyl-tripeptide--D-alanyl-D-alanine ligase [Bacteroidales bacterium]|nr:UDP-N-acetylmuramoyl-tripeptide--D-alanyl-D-alanine ligase [Bacteroidales bacterium]
MKNKIEEIYNLFNSFPNINTDSRKTIDNSLFFALKGENFNGNKFAEIALKNGAEYAIIDEKKFKKNNRYILVDNVLETLQKLAEFHRNKFNIPVIAITGTNGKTTTKELIHQILSKKYNTIATPGNFNNHIGVPLSLLSINKTTEIAIIEMGANHTKEISSLCKIAKPNYGLITNIGKAHLEGFKNIQGVIDTKNELYSYLYKNNGIAFVNKNNNILLNLSKNLKKIFYGTTDDCYCFGNTLEINPFLKIFYNNKKQIIQSQLIGDYNLENILSAICVGKYFKVDDKDIINAVEDYKPCNNRSQFVKTERNNIILDAYNANPVSVKAAINNFNLLRSDNKIVILGDMLELGDESISEHKNIIDLLSKSGFKNVILIGEIFSSINTKFKTYKNTNIALQNLKNENISSADILIKGSRKNYLEKLIKIL